MSSSPGWCDTVLSIGQKGKCLLLQLILKKVNIGYMCNNTTASDHSIETLEITQKWLHCNVMLTFEYLKACPNRRMVIP